MPEIQYNPIENFTVVVAPERKNRPNDAIKKANSDKCPFCPGNEDLTPPESFRINNENNDWIVRSFPNKYPAFVNNKRLNQSIHEVIVESNKHDLHISNFEKEHLLAVLQTYKKRIEHFLRNNSKTKQIVLFKNHGSEAGASLSHPHSQLVALDFVPEYIRIRNQNLKEYFLKKGTCFYCDELNNKNLVFENTHFKAVIPQIPRFSHECRIIPKTHNPYFENCKDRDLEKLAEVIETVAKSINKNLNYPAFNLVLNNGSYDESLDRYYHWNFSFIPRLAQLAGFEWATGIYINSFAPEEAAQQLRIRNR